MQALAADVRPRPIRFSTPIFKDHESSELSGCSKNSFPAFSITAGACALMCDHCQAKILEPMIPATNPEMLDERRASMMESAGVDTAMMDVIGSPETIRDVYHLDRPVEDFEATLAALCATSMEVVPHIVIGLHYGQILGETEALAICARHTISQRSSWSSSCRSTPGAVHLRRQRRRMSVVFF